MKVAYIQVNATCLSTVFQHCPPLNPYLAVVKVEC